MSYSTALSAEGLRPQTPDYYTEHPPHQPKREIAEYVRSQDILVPEIYDSLKTALQSGNPFIVRSEHPQDYAGASGLVSSHIVSPDSIRRAKEYVRDYAVRTSITGEKPLEDIAIANVKTLPAIGF